MTGTNSYLPEQIELILEQNLAGRTPKEILRSCQERWPIGPKGRKCDGPWELGKVVYVINKCQNDPRHTPRSHAPSDQPSKPIRTTPRSQAAFPVIPYSHTLSPKIRSGQQVAKQVSRKDPPCKQDDLTAKNPSKTATPSMSRELPQSEPKMSSQNQPNTMYVNNQAQCDMMYQEEVGPTSYVNQNQFSTSDQHPYSSNHNTQHQLQQQHLRQSQGEANLQISDEEIDAWFLQTYGCLPQAVGKEATTVQRIENPSFPEVNKFTNVPKLQDYPQYVHAEPFKHASITAQTRPVIGMQHYSSSGRDWRTNNDLVITALDQQQTQYVQERQPLDVMSSDNSQVWYPKDYPEINRAGIPQEMATGGNFMPPMIGDLHASNQAERTNLYSAQNVQNSHYRHHVPNDLEFTDSGTQHILPHSEIYGQRYEPLLMAPETNQSVLTPNIRSVAGSLRNHTQTQSQPGSLSNTGMATAINAQVLKCSRTAQLGGFDKNSPGWTPNSFAIATTALPRMQDRVSISSNLEGLTDDQKIALLHAQINQIKSRSVAKKHISRPASRSIVRQVPVRETLDRLSSTRQRDNVPSPSSRDNGSPTPGRSFLTSSRSTPEQNFESAFRFGFQAHGIEQVEDTGNSSLWRQNRHEVTCNPNEQSFQSTSNQVVGRSEDLNLPHNNEHQTPQFDTPPSQWLEEHDVFTSPDQRHVSAQLRQQEQWAMWKLNQNKAASVIVENRTAIDVGLGSSIADSGNTILRHEIESEKIGDILQTYQSNVTSDDVAESENNAVACGRTDEPKEDQVSSKHHEYTEWDEIFEEGFLEAIDANDTLMNASTSAEVRKPPASPTLSSFFVTDPVSDENDLNDNSNEWSEFVNPDFWDDSQVAWKTLEDDNDQVRNTVSSFQMMNDKQNQSSTPEKKD